MRTMTREGRKMTVHTALEKVEEEIAIMKQVRGEKGGLEGGGVRAGKEWQRRGGRGGGKNEREML